MESKDLLKHSKHHEIKNKLEFVRESKLKQHEVKIKFNLDMEKIIPGVESMFKRNTENGTEASQKTESKLIPTQHSISSDLAKVTAKGR